MKLLYGLHKLKNCPDCVAAIGNFDGVHLGHQLILTKLKQRAQELGLPATIIIFEPQPIEFFTKNKSLRLTSLREKAALFLQYNIDIIIILPFGNIIRSMTADDFINKILVKIIKTKYLIIGDDFSFGYNRRGDFGLLKKQIDLEVEQLDSFRLDGIRVSSTLIRTALDQNNLPLAAKLLGKPYSVCGRVIHGHSIGHILGFPTANINLSGRELPLNGVYIVKILGKTGLANIGFRPTFGNGRKSLEVFILDFSENIYGKFITVEFCRKIRDEQKFNSAHELQEQLQQDLLVAKYFLGI